MLPDLSGRRVLDLGCGFGWFCRWAEMAGASSVLGIDVSEKMLERAAEEQRTNPHGRAGITYKRHDLDMLTLPATSFDFAFSSLTLHYLTDLPRLFAQVQRALTPGASFVVSVEHPMMTAPSTQGWSTDRGGRRAWPVNDYLVEGPRVTNWLADGVVKQHRTTTTYLRTFREAGLRVEKFEEWGPTDAELAASPQLRDERARPTFLLMAANRI